jgi:ribosomal protein S7
MALTELTALESAYKALEPLGEAARRRALQWLSDALEKGQPLGDSAAATAAPVTEVRVPQQQQTRRRKAAPVTVAKSNRRQRKAKTSAGGERAYRRMPDPNEVMAAYEEVGTVSGLAEHFGVPRHTVNHWARRLRGQGYEIGRNS